MGQQYSSNIVNNITESLTNSILSETNTCQVNQAQVNFFSCRVNGDFNITNTTFLQNNSLTLNLTCAQQATASNTLSEDVVNTVTQITEQVAGDLNFTDQEQANLANNITKLATNIQTDLSNKCFTGISQTNGFVCEVGGNFNANNVTFEQGNFQQSLITCVASQSATQSAQISVQNTIDQKARQKTEGLIAALTWLVLAVGLVIALVIFGPELAGSSSILTFVLLIVAIVAIYFLLAYIFGWWPFNSDEQPAN